MNTFTAADVIERAEEYNVKFIRLQFTDIYGVLKNIAITVEELEQALEGRIPFDSSVIEGFMGNKESDIYLVPDPTTFKVFPWRPREGAVARLICDVYTPENQPFASCSRSLLKKVLKEADKQGYSLQVGTEVEFFLFNMNEQGKPTTVTHDKAGYCDLTPVDLGENARRDMVLTLEKMGFSIATSHHEISPGQHEISIRADNALAMADKIATFKFVVRTIAQRHGLHASFMPKPLVKHSGSGMNLHLSLWQGEENVFYQPEETPGLSRLAHSFIAGILHHADAICAMTNPLVNSYKRLVPSDVAPFLAAWSEENRSTSIRVPARNDQDTILAFRTPDPTSNPYLVIAVLLQCGLDGVAKGMTPPEKMTKNSNNGLQEKHLHLPNNLGEALEALENDKLLASMLGKRICNTYLEAKWQEWDEFQSEIHPWELERYLTYY